MTRAQRGMMIVLALALLAGCAPSAVKFPDYGCVTRYDRDREVLVGRCVPLDDDGAARGR